MSGRVPGRLRRRSERWRLSRFTIAAFAALFLAGAAVGGVELARGSAGVKRHAAGANAITIHVLLAAAVAVAVIVIQARRARHPGPRGCSPWAAPFSARALARLGRTLGAVGTSGRPSPPDLARAVAAVALAAVLLYAPFRMGAQVTGGLDPNATVNAWGGPSYPGALLAHWLDCLAGGYAAAFLLSRLLAPAPPAPGWRTRRDRGPAAEGQLTGRRPAASS